VPQPPQKGWWWNPAEGGRGYSIETSGNKLFFASYLYDASGRATWLIAAGPTSLDGSLFVGKLESYSADSRSWKYRSPTGAAGQDLTLAFTDASHGTMIWPEGRCPSSASTSCPTARHGARAGTAGRRLVVESDESGRGFLPRVAGRAALHGRVHVRRGGQSRLVPVRNSTPSSNLASYSNAWQLYGNGQTLSGTYQPPQQVNGNVAPVTITFQGAENAIMTLPNGRTAAIRRFRF
jgi:hypothetical protein